MNILLLRIPPPKQTIGLRHVMLCEPLELEILAASLHGLNVCVDLVDMMVDRRSLSHILSMCQPDVVAMSGYITHVSAIKTMAGKIRRRNEACRIIVGGVHAEVCPEHYDNPDIDYVIAANGFSVFREVIQRLLLGVSPWEEPVLPGLWQKGLPRPKPDMDVMPPAPDRATTARYRRYYYYLFHRPCALMKTSYGCPYTCTFCFCREITQRQYAERSLDVVIEELQEIRETDVYIVDDNFLVSRERVLAFCERVRAMGLQKRFLIYGRADFIAANPDVLKAFRDIGLRAVIVGLESCLDRELDVYAKQTSIAENEQSVQVLHSLGIDCYATLILGLDWGRLQFQQLGDWLKRMGLCYVNLQPFTPLPGTALYAEYQDRLLTDDPTHWDLAHLVVKPTQISISAYYWEMIKLYWRLALSPVTVLKHCRDYGVWQVFRLAVGAVRVNLQYLGKMMSSWFDERKKRHA
jgi:radical SAM superfamily enzyme YgiQ (UPF0313 family)